MEKRRSSHHLKVVGFPPLLYMNFKDLESHSPYEILEYLDVNYGVEVPTEIISGDDMMKAATLLGKLTNEYSYLMSLLSYAKIRCRDLKRNDDKRAYEDMIDRREVIQNKVDAVKSQYAAISRAVTIKIENDTELRMTGCR